MTLKKKLTTIDLGLHLAKLGAVPIRLAAVTRLGEVASLADSLKRMYVLSLKISVFLPALYPSVNFFSLFPEIDFSFSKIFSVALVGNPNGVLRRSLFV